MKTIGRLLVASMFLCAAPAARAQTNVADDEAIRKLYTDFFEAFRQGGAAGAVANLRQSGSGDPRVAQALERRLRAADIPDDRADSFAVLNETEIPNALRYRCLYFLTYHDTEPLAWRLRFYRRVTGVWVITAVQVEPQFVEDFLRLPELEFAAYRRILERARSSREEDRNVP